jgi:hypothetical protein
MLTTMVSDAPNNQIEPSQLLDIDIDVRLVDVWPEAWKSGEWGSAHAAAVLRLAYGRGYCDALTEGDRGRLCRDHGLAVPPGRVGRSSGSS